MDCTFFERCSVITATVGAKVSIYLQTDTVMRADLSEKK